MRDLSEINERLVEEFGDRVRIRWSNQHNHYSVEQKFNKGIASKWAEIEDDEMIRAREGYLQIFAVSPGDRIPCEKCGNELKVPINEFRMVECEWCKVRGYGSKYVVGYFDLDSDHIIDHLRRLDPLKGAGQKFREQIAYNNQKRLNDLHRNASNQAEDYVKDGMEAKLFGIPQTGINNVNAWADAPESVITNEKQKKQ